MYNAIICRIKTFPHPDADKIQLGNAHGFQVVVGLDTIDNELGVYFPVDGQLSEEMCQANDLISYKDEKTGEKKGGFFSHKRRVRAQKFRGQKSEGYWTPLKSLEFTKFDLSKLKEGDQFDKLNKIPVCNKYFTPATIRALKKQGKTRHNKCFHQHFDTKQFKYEVGRIPKGSLIYLTEKQHGTSARLANVVDTKEKTGLALFWAYLTNQPTETKNYDYLIGTRRVILGKSDKPSFYGSEEFRYNSVKELFGKLHKDEILYFEIVGYTTTRQLIMSSVEVKSELKDIKKKYGNRMTYKYGQVEGTCGIYIYRITRSNEDGVAIDLSWPQVKQRCRELWIKHVPEFLGHSEPIIYDGDRDKLVEYVESFVEGESLLDPSHIREGVVLRIENDQGFTFLKHKSHTFGVLEGYIKEKDDYVDMEEVS